DSIAGSDGSQAIADGVPCKPNARSGIEHISAHAAPRYRVSATPYQAIGDPRIQVIQVEWYVLESRAVHQVANAWIDCRLICERFAVRKRTPVKRIVVLFMPQPKQAHP